jgi:hypothetical protein
MPHTSPSQSPSQSPNAQPADRAADKVSVGASGSPSRQPLPPLRLGRLHLARPSWIVVSLGLAACSGTALGASLILNEYNAVGSQKWLGNPDSVACEGPAGLNCADEEDTYLGRVLGNGGDWLELVVTVDHLDLRGWKLQIAELDNVGTTNGQNLWQGNPNLEQGIITFSEHSLWADLRAGTIITITERTTSEGGLDSDLSFDPCNGDWWINANSFDATLLSTMTNVLGDGPGNFSVGNDGFVLRVVNTANAVMFGPVGEGAAGYGGGGVNSREICRLEEDPSAALDNFAQYDDGDNSTFGSPNRWGGNFAGIDDQCRFGQQFDLLRAPVLAECTACRLVILNEYNAVSNDAFLNGGTQEADEDGLQASDSFFGRVAGNGGSWFELVVLADHVDMRGWELYYEELGDDEEGSIFLSDHPFWADLRAGTILTFIDRGTASGGLDTDLNVDPDGDYLWANIMTFDSALIAGTTSNLPGHIPGDFGVGKDDWRLTILDSDGAVVAGPSGEGSIYFYQGKVGGTDVCRLKEDPSNLITPASAYDDSEESSTFGAPNTWKVCPIGVLVTQDFSRLPALGCEGTPPGDPADLNGDGIVSGADLGQLLAAWGTSDPVADINGDGVVDGADLGALLAAWS